MKMAIIALVGVSLALPACTDRWSATAMDGTALSVAEPECRAIARESARRQMPFLQERGVGFDGLLPDSTADIERREMALCLQNRGFKMTRE